MGIMLWFLVGAALGAISRWVMPGPEPIGTLGAVLLGASAGFAHRSYAMRWSA